jgi:cyclopropane fatty-acyl-phospholipid synthase-like methyltransferase
MVDLPGRRSTLDSRTTMSSHAYRKRLYENYASATGSAQTNDSAKRPFWRHVAAFVGPTSSKVLELGAGSGGLLEELRSAGFHDVRGVDGSPEQVALARARGVGVRHGDALAELRDTQAGAVDVIIAIDVVEHLGKDEVLELLDECFRVLPRSGRLIVHTVNGASPFFGRVRFGDFTHETTFTPSSMRQLLSVVGFGTVRFVEDRPLVHGVVSATRRVLWEAFRMGFVVALAAETGTLDPRQVLSQNFLTIASR